MKEKIEVTIQAIKVADLKLKVEGMTPLLMNKFSDEAKQGLLDKQAGKSKERAKRTKEIITKEIESCIHRLPDGQAGFPASGFKKAMVEAATGKLLEGMNGKLAKGAFFIMGNLVPIKYKKQVINEAIGRIGRKIPMVTFRPEFQEWTAELPIKYNSSQVTAQQIIALANLAGFHIGVGDWRPQCNGSYGTFKVFVNGVSK